MGKKLTKNERNWILYDVGNSAFTLLIATILPIYFNYLAGNAGISSVDYLAYWGYAASVGTILVALAGPVLGTMADTKGFKNRLFKPFGIRHGDFNPCDWLRIAWSGKGLAVVSGYLHHCKSRIFKQPDFL